MKKLSILIFFLSFNLSAQVLDDCIEEISDSETVYYQPIQEVITTRDSMGQIRLEIYKDMIRRKLFNLPQTDLLEVQQYEYKVEKTTMMGGVISSTRTFDQKHVSTQIFSLKNNDDSVKVKELLDIFDNATSHSSAHVGQVVHLQHADGKWFEIDFRSPLMMNPIRVFDPLPQEKGISKYKVAWPGKSEDIPLESHNQFLEDVIREQTYQYVKGCDKSVVIGTRSQKFMLGLPITVYKTSSPRSSSSAR